MTDGAGGSGAGVAGSSPIRLTLTPRQHDRAMKVADERRGEDMDRANRRGFSGDGAEIDQLGALAECACAAVLGVAWMPRGFLDRHLPDVGFVDVRATKGYSNGLILHRDSTHHRPFVLMIGADREWRYAGWCLAMDGKRDRYWREDVRHPCFIVPQHHLSLRLPTYRGWMT